MKKILLTVFLTLSLGISQTKADISAPSYFDKLDIACATSKLSNPVITIGGTLLIVPTLYFLSNYINSKLLRIKENNGSLSRFIKRSSKLIANISLTSAQAGLAIYLLSNLDTYPKFMKLFGYNKAEILACSKIIWPNIKNKIAGMLSL